MDENRQFGEESGIDRLRESILTHEERLNELEQQTGDGHRALTNQRRIVLYLRELRRFLDARCSDSPPQLPEFDELV